MNRNYYCKVNSQEEADKLLKVLSNIDENILTTTSYIKNSWNIIGFHESRWCLLDSSYLKKDFIKVPASELIHYVTGKKLDKDALLEEAKRRYPVGTKYRVKEYSSGNYYLEGTVSKTPYWSNNGKEDIISGYDGILWSSKYGWSEIVEEPKVETNSIAEEFVLPEKWCVKVTRDNYEIIDTWKLTTEWNSSAKSWKYVRFDGVGCETVTGNTEITFDQFKKYVLKDNVKEEIKKDKNSDITWKIGDYVVFTVDWCSSKRGDIDKIKKLGSSIEAIILEKEGLAGSPLYTDCKLKVFPTLQEAQKFSDELLGKSKTGLRVEDLVKGEIYCSLMSDKPQWESLHLYHGNGENMFKYRLYIHSSYKGNDKFDKSDWGKCTSNQYRLATSLEKKWLKTCIKQDKFIEQSELDKYDDEGNLMESKEYPEYYECIKPELWENTIKSNNGNLIFSGNFITKTGNTIEHEHLHQYGHFKISTKSAYDAQFKKDEDYKVGDWVVIEDSYKLENGCIGCPEGIFKIIKDTKEHIHGLVRSNNTYLIQTSNAVWRISNQGVRKALPWEIPVENSVKQYPYTPEESIKLDFEVKWKEPRYIGGVDSITATGWGIYEQMKKQPIQSRKTPDLIDKTKVKVEIKRTKAKQIKL